jgi:hypothetical protein
MLLNVHILIVDSHPVIKNSVPVGIILSVMYMRQILCVCVCVCVCKYIKLCEVCIVLYLFTFLLSYRYGNSHFNRM